MEDYAVKPKSTQLPIQTTTAGAPVADNQNSLTAGPRVRYCFKITN